MPEILLPKIQIDLVKKFTGVTSQQKLEKKVEEIIRLYIESFERL